MNKDEAMALVGEKVAYMRVKRGLRPPSTPAAAEVFPGRIRVADVTWWYRGRQRRNGVEVERLDQKPPGRLDEVEPVSILCTWEEWEQRLQSREAKDEQDLRGERLARGLGGIYMRNTSGGVVLLDLDTAEKMMGDTAA